MLLRFTMLALSALCSLVLVGAVSAQVCGDVNDSGKVTAADALTVLKTAVGLDVPLTCDGGDCMALEARMDALEDETLVASDGEGNLLGRMVGDANGGPGKTIFVKSIGKLLRLNYVADEDLAGFSPIGPEPVSILFSEPDCNGGAFALTTQEYDENYVFSAGDGHAYVASGRKAKPHLLASKITSPAGNCETDVRDISADDNGNHIAFDLVEVALPFDLPAPGPFQIAPLR